MKLIQLSCEEFIAETFSKSPVPGGGSVAAVTAALGVSLEGMVCSLTQGKKKYEQYEEDIASIVLQVLKIKTNLLALVDQDAQNFYPLSQVYSLKANTEQEIQIKEIKMQEALKIAVKAPVQIVRECYDAIQFLEELMHKCSKLAISDVGCAAQLLKSALLSSWMNVLVNLELITDEKFNKECKEELMPMIQKGSKSCDFVYNSVLEHIEV